MLRAALALLLLAAPLAQARDWARAACEDDQASCRETCTIADGTELDSRGRLERCLNQCQQELQRCQFRRLEARRQKERQVPAPATQVISDAPAPGAAAAPVSSSSPAPSPDARAQSVPSDAHPASTPVPGPRPAASTLAHSDAMPASQPPVHPLAASQPPAELFASPPRRQVVKAPDYDRLGSGPVEPASTRPAVPVASTPSGSDTDALLDPPKQSPSKPATRKPKHKKDLSQWDPSDLE